MVRQNLVLPYLSQKWYGSCRACRTGGAAHAAGQSQIRFHKAKVIMVRAHHISMPDFLDTDSFFNLIIQTQLVAEFRCHQRPRRCSVPTPTTSRLPSSENCRLFTKPTYAAGKNTISECTPLFSLRFNGHYRGKCGLAGTRMSTFWILLMLRMIEVVEGIIQPTVSENWRKRQWIYFEIAACHSWLMKIPKVHNFNKSVSDYTNSPQQLWYCWLDGRLACEKLHIGIMTDLSKTIFVKSA